MPTSDPATPWIDDPAVPPLVARYTTVGGGAPAPGARIHLYLHGAGATEDDLLGLSHTVDRDGIHIAYRAPIPYGNGFCWFPLGWRGDSIEIDDSVAPHSRDRIARQLSLDLERLGRAGSRVTVIGFSQGASMALATAATNPGLFDRVVLLSGLRLPALLDTVPEGAPLPPILVQHGTADPIVPIDEGRALARWCLERNPHGTTFDEFDMPHTISQESLDGIAGWLGANP